MPQQTLEAFREAGHEADLPVHAELVARIEEGLADAHLGFIMKDNLERATGLIREGSPVLPVEDVPAAMATLAYLLSEAGVDYRKRKGEVPNPLQDEWVAHMANVREGRIELLPRQFWSTPPRGKRQVRRADEMLNNSPQGVEQVLAALNYGLYFQPGTMAGAARTLATSPAEIATSEELEAMPHLSVSNWIIGQTAGHLYEHVAASPHRRLHVVDMCSGTGATLAAITSCMSDAQAAGQGMDGRVSVTGFEATPAFHEMLTGDYLPAARPYLDGLGIRESAAMPLADFHNELRPGEINLVEGDVVEGVAKLDLSEVTPADILLATVNYGFHRIPSRRKAAIMKKLAEVENCVLVIGDLRRNSSAVNLGYFNLANNGPLNTGNIGLEAELEEQGYTVRIIGQEWFKPPYVEPVLRERLHQELDNDGFVTVAVKGPTAHELLLGEESS